MSDHPLDMHPRAEAAALAWSIIKQSQQPEFNDLPVSYRSELLDAAERALSGEPIPDNGAPIDVFQRQLVEAQRQADEAAKPADVDDDGEDGDGKPKRGKLPEDFPAYAALEAAGEATYAKVRKRIAAGTLTDISGIGSATAARIEEAMSE